ncbi:MAG: S8 family serine peptidase [Mogibacterium sp.]|nr:S8 family serine peptidase [Mogibacterium sp.]
MGQRKNKDISANTSDVIKALRDCVENGNADVINMSFCISGANSLLEEECKNAADKGVILVAASGNSEIRELLYPASFDSVISVGSVDKRRADGSISRSNFSTYNNMVDAVAPGNTMTCLGADGQIYVNRKGTSFSSPEVAALAAMAKSAHKKIDVDAFRRYLSRTCVDLGKSGKDEEYGYGLVDFDAVYGMTRDLADISGCEINIEDAGLVYNGKCKTPDVSVVLNGQTLTKDTDYSVSYSNNLNAGENAIVRISGIGKHVGSAREKFVIEQADVSGIGLSVANCTYTGKALKPAVKDTRVGAALVSGTDCTLAYSGNVSLGQASVKIAGMGNYKGTTTKYFNILPGKATIRTPKSRTRVIQVNWSRRSNKMKSPSGNYIHVRGYQVQLSKSKTFSSVTKKTASGYRRTSAKFRGLKRNTRYYMRVRTYVKLDGKYYYSYWSGTKTIKTK